ncbi:MAG: hypothetical protein MUP45_02400 [Candidatus Marinimicrobia bacterium]|nr:hypothetical protein [Candidatus Neomarinimicrobiota bacterium]
MTLAVVLMTVGALVSAGSFLYAVVNITTQAKNVIDPNKNTDLFTGFWEMFKRHIGAMIAMAIGGLLVVGGMIMLVVQVLPKTI